MRAFGRTVSSPSQSINQPFWLELDNDVVVINSIRLVESK